MSRVCQITGRGTIVGNNVSHSNRKTKRKFNVNLVNKKFYVPELDKTISLKIAADVMRTIDKKGIYNVIKESKAKGLYTGVEL